MEKTNEQKPVNPVPAFVAPPHTFEKEVMVTAYEAREIPNRDNPLEPPAIWHAVSVSDGGKFQMRDISADKTCAPEQLKPFEKYVMYFDLQQKPNKNGNLSLGLKIVGYRKV